MELEKEKIEASRNELQQLQSQNRGVQQKIEQVQTQLDQYRKEEQQLSVQINTLTAGSSNGQNTPSIPDLPSDLNIPSFGEPDAVSARATVSSESLWTFRTYLCDVCMYKMMVIVYIFEHIIFNPQHFPGW